MSEKSFILDVLKSGGIIKPLIIPSETNNQTGLFNPDTNYNKLFL